MDSNPFDLQKPSRPAEGLQLSYSINEVSAATGLGRTTIYAAIKTGDLIARKCGRRTTILAEDLSSFLRNLPRTVAG
jgi:excisionase family DNA binding protein